jgi:hypothetical protein
MHANSCTYSVYIHKEPEDNKANAGMRQGNKETQKDYTNTTRLQPLQLDR